VSTAVAGIVENVKLTGAPALRQLPRGIKRAADVVAAVDQDAGNAVQCRGITEQLVLPEEGGVSPVVRDQAREPEAKFRIFVARIREMAGGEGDVRIFPGAPLPCRVIADRGIGVKQQRGVRIGQRQVPQCVGHGCGEPVPLAGEDAADVAGDPFDFATGCGGHERQHQCVDPPRVCLGVGQAKGGSPGHAQDGPALDPVELAQRFDVGDEMGGGVGAQVGIGRAGERSAASGSTLVEEYDPIGIRIEEASLARREA